MQVVNNEQQGNEELVVVQQSATQISFEEIEVRESAISSDTVYCCIIHGTF